MSIALTSFVRRLLGRFPTAPNALLKEALLEAAREFCARSKILTDSYSITTSASTVGYDIAHATLEIVSGVELRNDSDFPLDELSLLQFQTQYPTDGRPTKYTISEGQALLWPTPDAIETLTGKGVFRPKSDATSVPDILYDDWRETILAGARYRLHTENVLYADAASARVAMDAFEAGVWRASHKRAKGGTEKRLRTKGVYF